MIATWDDLKGMLKASSSFQTEQIATLLPIVKKNLKQLADAGVIIAAGRDAGNIGTLHGPSLHREFELMSEAGLSPMQIIVAASRDAARVTSARPEVGTIEPGKFADLLVLDANPLENIRNARRIHTVVKGGLVISRSELVTP